MGVHVIDQPKNQTEQWLLDIVAKQAHLEGIDMPEVGIFQATEANAFATGMNKNSALVAVSTGLLQNMNTDEVEAVVGHEMTHVANGDMVTMALMQGVVNTFVFFFATIIGHFVERVIPLDEVTEQVAPDDAHTVEELKSPGLGETENTAATTPLFETPKPELPNARPSLHIDVQIHIDPSSTAEQIDHIFESMARHLYGK